MKRILVFSLAYHPMIGGAEIALREIAGRLKKDFDFTIICARFNKRFSESEQIDGIPVYRVGNGTFYDKYFFPFLALKKALSLGKFDGAWAMMENYALIAAFFYYLKTGTNYLLSLQSGDSDLKLWSRIFLIYPLYFFAHRKAKRAQAISRFLALRANKFGYQGKVEVIPNGVNLGIFKSSGEEKNFDEPKIITVSRLVYKNGIDALVESLIYLPQNYTLEIIGDGPERKKLEKLAINCAARERIKFLGSLFQQNAAQHLRQAHIFARPSRSEGFGNAFIEAMACGVPVIGTLVGGIKDFLIDRKTGLAAETDNPQDTARAIMELAQDKNLREEIIRNGLELAKFYSWDKIAVSMAKLLEEVCA